MTLTLNPSDRFSAVVIDSEWADWWRRQGEEELRLILWAAWDPIGRVPRDEYEDYAPHIASLLRSGATPEEVAAVLGTIRTESIGLAADPDRDVEVAQELQDWYEHPFFGTDYPSPSEFAS
jgi:hypothetical protein